MSHDVVQQQRCVACWSPRTMKSEKGDRCYGGVSGMLRSIAEEGDLRLFYSHGFVALMLPPVCCCFASDHLIGGQQTVRV